ncbi:hypothetical protein [Candidatus Acidianus copahuensis]|nr:hypothetical protein [Candidatus Acidianus copahuensis]
MHLPTLIAILSSGMIDGIDVYKGGLFSLYFKRVGDEFRALISPLFYTLMECLPCVVAFWLWNDFSRPEIIILSGTLLSYAIMRIPVDKYIHYVGDVKPTLRGLAKWSWVNSLLCMDFIPPVIFLLIGKGYFLAFLIGNITFRYLAYKINVRILRINFSALFSLIIAITAVIILF